MKLQCVNRKWSFLKKSDKMCAITIVLITTLFFDPIDADTRIAKVLPAASTIYS